MYNERGYIEGAPLRLDRWNEIVSDQPGGVIITAGGVPPGFLMVQNFLAPQVCDAIVAECDQQLGEQHTVASSGADLSPQRSDTRTSEFVDVRSLNTDVIGIVKHIFANVVGHHFQKGIDWFELPEILRYREGGEYKPHADADNWDPAKREWTRVLDRDYSILLYLNEGYTGGEIDFPNFGLKLAPKKGLLIAFPSDARYVHAARPVTSGVRYALVSWAAAKGTLRTSLEPRPHSIRM
ncbi:prolyl hydroxylase family protein [Hyphococcus sp.]|jgi:predicted 2-oxoglutarate/Fe(II)-dependent dioxygenase YbiX|uniref:prolyl hydroxylase family protein n=1 Tax=Hyphococcus sp. TaxID=2038636 RepID=UPI003D109D70